MLCGYQHLRVNSRTNEARRRFLYNLTVVYFWLFFDKKSVFIVFFCKLKLFNP